MDRNYLLTITTALWCLLTDVTTLGTISLTQTKPDENATEANLQTVSDYRGSLGPAIGGSIAEGFVLGVLAAAVVFYLRERILQKQKNREQSKHIDDNASMSASHEEQSQSDTDRHLDSTDIELASASRHCEATLYEKLSEQNKGHLYDHLEQPSENKIKQDVGELRSNVDYYKN